MSENNEKTLVQDKTVARSLDIVEKHVYYSMGVGLLPFPLLDVAAITGIQIKMLKEITESYGQKFNRNLGKTIITSLLSSLTASSISFGFLGQGLKAIPGIGTLLGIVAMPIAAGGLTYALGSVFITYYENGGDFAMFDIESASSDLHERLEGLEMSVDGIKKAVNELKKTAAPAGPKAKTT